MKKIFFFTFLLPVTAFVYQSCQPVDNSKEMAKSDSMADARLVMFRDSLNMSCMADVMAAARLRADSLMEFAMHKKGAKAPSKPKPPVKQPGVGDRPGAEQPKTISDRKGTTDSTNGPKKISDRKGVNTPPK